MELQTKIRALLDNNSKSLKNNINSLPTIDLTKVSEYKMLFFFHSVSDD